MSCPSVTNLTDSDLTQNYQHASGKTILPSVSYSTTDRTSSGLLHPSALSSIVSSFSTQDTPPISVENMISEYCFYHARYTYAIKKVVDQLHTDGSSDAAPSRSPFYLKQARYLHQQLMDFIQTIQAIIQALNRSTKPIDPAMNVFSNDLQTQQKTLETQQKIVRSNQASAALYKQMVRYSEEKTRRSDQLLHLYTFLNVITLGLLVYVYKAAE